MLNDVISKIMNGNEMNNYKPINNQFNLNNPSPFDISRESGKIEFFEKHYQRAESKQKMGMGSGGTGVKISSYPGNNKDYGDPDKSFKRATIEKEPILLNFTDVEEIKYEVPSSYYAYQGKKQLNLTPLERGLERDDQMELDEEGIARLPQARADFIRRYKQQRANQALQGVNRAVRANVPRAGGGSSVGGSFGGSDLGSISGSDFESGDDLNTDDVPAHRAAAAVGGGHPGRPGRTGPGEIDTGNIQQGSRRNNIPVGSAQAVGGGESKDNGKKKNK